MSSLDTPPTEGRPGRLTAHEARQRLEHERDARLTQLRAIDDAGRDVTDQVMSVQKEAVRRVLAEIEAAFARVGDGSYGTCLGCSRPVPAERLEILPYTRFCVACQRHSD
ncbi:TraR/DksA C4-type zinc finger protein [Streptomyces sp. ID05-39B]|uniref:TraR/DksA family transcriptional regulator n=1 Tax=Streptomyces sp. ID05-39B TaxID=3028664 RepID=UPI0029BD0B14|nr:TraR/DksA C4-type zinc finger protein [Streptomyces sp. ID05-39B]MDX3527304.1 TraR/DksA C4-type zinc finger protein [Streptomyces sp. ID05-39B]